MRIAIITPLYDHENRGNAVTVRRIVRNLRKLGCIPVVIGLDSISPDTAVKSLMAGGYDLCHAFHAYKGGDVAHRLAESAGVPYVVTLTGSDVNEALFDIRRDKTLAILAGAARIVAFHNSIKERLAHEIPILSDRTTVIAQGVQLPTANTARPADGDFVFLLPAGLRSVKNVLFPLEPLAKLALHEPRLRLIIVGPVLDEAYASEVMIRLRDYPFASYIGVMEHVEMAELYRNAAVVLNSSLSEGGMANSLLEAMAWGRPVLASDIEGNRSLVADGVNGFLYRGANEFCEKAELLLTDTTLREKLARAALDKIIKNHTPEHEAAEYQKVYSMVVDSAPCEPAHLQLR